ncbi:MAG: hypothetical protein QM831_14890 [Kofleriaceae bacterium]
MQLTRGFVAFLLLAACGDDTKLALQVVAPQGSGVKTVELWISDEDCNDCKGGIAPPAADQRPMGSVHLVAGATAFTAAVDSDGIATFGIGKGDGGDVTINKIAAVGYDANNTPIALVVDDQGFDLAKQLGEIRRYELVPTDITAKVQPDASDGTVLWRTDPNGVGCLWANGEFFVPPGDPDCDGFTGDQECDEDWYDFKGDLTDQVCEGADATHGGACVIGYEAGCADGSTGGACEGEVCVGEALCNDMQCRVDPVACIGTHADSLPRIDCTIPLMTTSTATFIGVCPGQGNSFNFGNGVTHCNASFIQTLQFPPMLQSKLSFSDATYPVGEITIANTGSNPCSVTFATALATNATTDSPVLQRGALALENGNSPIAVLPIFVKFVNTTGDCNSGPIAHIQCTPANLPNDSITKCLQ